MPSAAYDQSVADQQAHHGRSKTFSGSLLIPHRYWLAAMSRRLNATSALEYGCGKGTQYTEPMLINAGAVGPLWQSFENVLGYTVTKYDPCIPEFAEDPEPCSGYDIVIVSHVLFWIPTEDLRAWVLPRIFGLARKAVFFAEKVGPEKKRFLTDRGAHPRDLHAIDWIDMLMPDRIEHPELECHLATSYRAMDGRLITGRWEL